MVINKTIPKIIKTFKSSVDIYLEMKDMKESRLTNVHIFEKWLSTAFIKEE